METKYITTTEVHVHVVKNENGTYNYKNVQLEIFQNHKLQVNHGFV